MVKKRGKSKQSVCTDDSSLAPGYVETPGRSTVIPNEADAGGGMRKPIVPKQNFGNMAFSIYPETGKGTSPCLC